MDDAEDKYISARSKYRSVDNSMSEDLFQTISGQSRSFRQSFRRYIDELSRRAALSANNSQIPFNKIYEEHLNLRDYWPIYDNLPRGVDLSLSLEIDQKHTKSWNQPAFEIARPPFKIDMVNTVDFDPNIFQDQVTSFNQGLSAYRLNHFNVNPIALSLETILVYSSSMNFIIKCHKEKTGCYVPALNIEDLNEEEYKQLPSLLLISNGYYALGFNFGLEDITVGSEGTEFSYRYSELPAQVIEFLKSLPVLYTHFKGPNIEGVLSDFFFNLYGAVIEFNIINITSIAVAAGCKADHYSLYTLSLIVDGKPFIDILRMQYEYVKSNKLCNLYKKYLIEKMIILQNSYAVLVGLLIRQMFPDPDITLSITEMSQHSFTYWFSEFLSSALHTVKEFHKLSTAEMSTRCEMIESITDKNNDFARALCELLIDVPVAQEGGERFLHHARKCFLDQYHVIKRLNFDLFKCQAPNQEVDIDQLGYRFLYKRDVDVKNHGHPATKSGLLPNPEFEDSLYEFDAAKDDVSVLYRQTDRDLVPAIEEWGRLNVNDIKVLLDRVRDLRTDQLARFWIPKIRLYEILIAVFYRITNEQLRVNYLERCISTKLSNVKSHHEELQARRASQYQQIRHDYVLHNIQAGTSRVGLHQEAVSKVPSFNNARNIKKQEKRKARLARRKAENAENWVSRATLKKAKISGSKMVDNTKNLDSREAVKEAKTLGSLEIDDLRRKLV